MICLANLAEKSEQEVFNWIVTKLMEQGKKSVDARSHCMYRGEDGCKCAAGWVIGDDEYTVSFEDQTWSSLVAKYDYVPSSHSKLIYELQHIHDAFTVDKWKNKFILLADDRGLSLPECLN
jgi:hypothetical protein